jgi:hypothetical protein
MRAKRTASIRDTFPGYLPRVRQVEGGLHSDHCVAHAINSGNKNDAQRKFAGLMELFGKIAR